MTHSGYKSVKGVGLACLARLLVAAGSKPKNIEAADAKGAKTVGDAKSFPGLIVYTDDKSPKNHYAPSGWMGDYAGIKMDTASTENPHAGTSCVKFTFKPSG